MSEHACPHCERSFDSHRGMKKHRGAAHDPNYKDEGWLREQYVERGKSLSELSDIEDVSESILLRYMDKYGIERRGYGWTVGYADFRTDANGYEWWRSWHDGEYSYVKVHRLLAVAEYGFEAVQGKHVHHENSIRWDNRSDNIDLMDPNDHLSYHYSHPYDTKVDKEMCDRFREAYKDGLKYSDIAEDVDVSKSTVARHTRGDCQHDGQGVKPRSASDYC